MYVCANSCGYIQRPEGYTPRPEESVRYLGAGGCKLPNVRAGNGTWVLYRSNMGLDFRAISPAPGCFSSSRVPLHGVASPSHHSLRKCHCIPSSQHPCLLFRATLPAEHGRLMFWEELLYLVEAQDVFASPEFRPGLLGGVLYAATPVGR